jgi:vacuolar protein sorting-associated protein 45
MQITAIVDKDEVFDLRRQEGPLLVILDRRDDPVTPLLTQWTYQAMVHELLGLNYNRVVLKDVPGIQPDLEEVVLSCTSDPFFARNMNANFGDLGTAVKRMLDDYQHKSKKNENINSIEDMQAFLDRYRKYSR